MAFNVDYLERILKRYDWRRVAEYITANAVTTSGGGGGEGSNTTPPIVIVQTSPPNSNNSNAASTAYVDAAVATALEGVPDAESLTILLGQIVTALRLVGVDPAELEPGIDESIMIAS